MLPALLQHLQSHHFPSLHYLRVSCNYDSEVRALTTFLHQCTNLRTLHCERDGDVSESVVEEMWVAAVRRCNNLEEVRVEGVYRDVTCDRLVSVLKKLSEREGMQVQKLRKIVEVDWDAGKVQEKDYTEQVKHLLPALQQ